MRLVGEECKNVWIPYENQRRNIRSQTDRRKFVRSQENGLEKVL